MRLPHSRVLLAVTLVIVALALTVLAVVFVLPQVQGPDAPDAGRSPEYAESLRAATEAFSSGDSSAAESALLEAVEEFPDDPVAHALLARVYESEGLLEQALDEYRRSLELDPDQAELHHRVGVILYSGGDIAGAIAELETAVSVDGDFVGGRLFLADLYEEDGRMAEAAEQLSAVLELEPIGVDLDEIRERRDRIR